MKSGLVARCQAEIVHPNANAIKIIIRNSLISKRGGGLKFSVHSKQTERHNIRV